MKVLRGMAVIMVVSLLIGLSMGWSVYKDNIHNYSQLDNNPYVTKIGNTYYYKPHLPKANYLYVSDMQFVYSAGFGGGSGAPPMARMPVQSFNKFLKEHPDSTVYLLYSSTDKDGLYIVSDKIIAYTPMSNLVLSVIEKTNYGLWAPVVINNELYFVAQRPTFYNEMKSVVAPITILALAVGFVVSLWMGDRVERLMGKRFGQFNS